MNENKQINYVIIVEETKKVLFDFISGFEFDKYINIMKKEVNYYNTRLQIFYFIFITYLYLYTISVLLSVLYTLTSER